MGYGRLIKDFIYYTGKDFQYIWRIRPNVLIWCGIAGVILFLM